MLLRFGVKNFSCFEEKIELDLTSQVRGIKNKNSLHIIKNKKREEKVLPLAIIYGQNNFEKSSLFQSVLCFKEYFIHDLYNFKFKNDGQEYETYFEFCLDNKKYYYQVNLLNKNIVQEKLIINDKIIFNRLKNKLEVNFNLIDKEDFIHFFNFKYLKNEIIILESNLDSKSLFLKNGFSNRISKKIFFKMKYFFENKIILFDKKGNYYLNEQEDLGDKSEIYLKSLNVSGIVLDSLREGKTLFIDDLDVGISVEFVNNIIDNYMDKDINIHFSQLIFSSHNPIFIKNKNLILGQFKIINKQNENNFFISNLLKENLKIDKNLDKSINSFNYFLNNAYNKMLFLNIEKMLKERKKITE